MELLLDINVQRCICCGKCVRVCPSMVFGQEKAGSEVQVLEARNCIGCGHCVAVCPAGAVEHLLFPAEKVHAFEYSGYPTAEQMMLLCRARRSNRAFADKPVPEELLEQILEAAHHAPTASNMQGVGFTVVTDPVKLQLVSDFTLEVFTKAFKKMNHPVLKPLVKLLMPDTLHYAPVFKRIMCEREKGNDLILRKAKTLVFIHTPQTSRFGCQDANLAYQNGSLMAECLGVSQFYTGFVCSAIQQEGKRTLEKILGIEGRIHAGMALGMPAFRFENYVERNEINVKKW